MSLVRNEDRYVERALRNVSDFCDLILVADHMSTDRTWEIISELARELDHVRASRIAHSAESHGLVEGFAGTDTWILSIDGDEIYDPSRLPRLRNELAAGAHDDVFRIRPAALHCDDLDPGLARAAGHFSPPGRPLLGLLNFAAIDSWSGVRSERLHGGDIRFRPGFDMDSWRHFGMEYGWTGSSFRALHLCFLPRSSADPPVVSPTGRPNLSETGEFRRGLTGTLERTARHLAGRRGGRVEAQWKAEKYRRGERASVDVTDFFT